MGKPNFSKRADVEALIARTIAEFVRADILVNSAWHVESDE